MDAHELLTKQRAYFLTGATWPVKTRIENLKKLRDVIKHHETEIGQALSADLGKSDFESFMCEIGLTCSEITYLMKRTKGYAAKHRVCTPLAQFAASSYRQSCPYGNVLIMSPWNYPFLLTMEPLAAAIAAGNTAIVKPSAYAPHTSKIVEKIIGECFAPEFVATVTGGREENKALLNEKFDFVFFTGSQNVGREVLRHTAENLTPAVLELGGKSPCIVDETVKIKLAAKRIVFGKYLNCGQTCVAPDYVLCHKAVKSDLIRELCAQIEIQYGKDAFSNSDYGKIINEKHFDRICSLVDKNKIACGGRAKKETLQIEPTVMDNVTWDDAIMEQEIFGPVLPVLTYETTEEILSLLADRPKPLALYVFSENKQTVQLLTKRLSYGGGCVNDTIIHLATSEMGFGGVGESGMGAYHGKVGFDAFSHTKSIVDKKTWMDLPMRYQPYKKGLYGKLLHLFLR